MAAPNVDTRAVITPLAEESELAARITASDETAYETLYLAYFERLWRFAYGYVRSREIAEELVHDVFLALWRDRTTWDIRTSVRAWLYGSVRHHALNHLRHERIVGRLQERTAMESGTGRVTESMERETDVAGMGARIPDAHAMVEAHELNEVVARALASLPEKRRVAMTLSWNHDLSPAEIAQALGTTPESVRVLLSRARHDLTQWLGRGWS